MARLANLDAGATTNQYEILLKLASGGMAEIFIARARTFGDLERYVVLKRVLPERSRDPDFIRMFLDEARLAAQLHHPNIAQVYDIGRIANGYFFTMEYVHGHDASQLAARVRALKRQIPIGHALTIVAGAAAGLHHAHDRRGADTRPLGVVHRDVSPSNIMVSFEGAVKLVDFGVAKAAHRATETRAGTIKGKIEYLSPEQCRGQREIDRRSDVFSLGIVLWELLTGKRLFRRDSDFLAMSAIVHEDVEPPSKHRPDLAAELDRVVLTALAREPAQRYSTAGAMLEDLEQIATRHQLAISTAALGRYLRELFGERPEPWIEHAAADRPVASTIVTVATENHLLDPTTPVKDDAELEHALAALAIVTAPAVPVHDLSAPVHASVVEPPRRSRAWLVALAILVGGAIGGVVYVATRSREPAAVAANTGGDVSAGTSAGSSHAGDSDSAGAGGGNASAGTSAGSSHANGSDSAGTAGSSAGTSAGSSNAAGNASAGTRDMGSHAGGNVSAGTRDTGSSAGGSVSAGTRDTGSNAGGSVSAGTRDTGSNARNVSAGAPGGTHDAARGSSSAGTRDTGSNSAGVSAGTRDTASNAGGSVSAGTHDAARGTSSGGTRDGGTHDSGRGSGSAATGRGNVSAGTRDGNVSAGTRDGGSAATRDGHAVGSGSADRTHRSPDDAKPSAAKVLDAIRRRDWPAALATCMQLPSVSGVADSCTVAACTAKRTALAAEYLRAAGDANRARLVATCQRLGVVLERPSIAPPVDPCEADPMSCQR